MHHGTWTHHKLAAININDGNLWHLSHVHAIPSYVCAVKILVVMAAAFGPISYAPHYYHYCLSYYCLEMPALCLICYHKNVDLGHIQEKHNDTVFFANASMFCYL